MYNKAIIATLVPIIMIFLQNMGITGDTSISDALTIVLTGGLTWLIPNRG